MGVVRETEREVGREVRSRAHAVRALSWQHPHVVLALRTGLAAGLAWLLVQPVGGFVREYPYYAPLGAMVATSTSIVGSVRSSAQAVSAIAVGVGLALGIRALPVPEPLALVVGIVVGMLVSALPWFGTMASWVPFAALFELIAGAHDPWRYAAAYGGLTAFGALVGVVVNVVLPQLPLTPAVRAQEHPRRRLADQLDLLADGLDREERLDEDDWARRRTDLDPEARRVEELLGHVLEARRGNWTARRWTEVTERRAGQARALLRLTGCVDEVIALVADVRVPLHGADERAAAVRRATAGAFREVAAMLRSPDEVPQDAGAEGTESEDAGAGALARATAAVEGLRHEAAQACAEGGDQYLAAASIAVSLHQAVEAWS